MHDVKIMMDQIDGPVWQFSEDASFHPVMSCTEPPKLLLVKFNAKQNFVELRYPLKYFHNTEVLGRMVLLYLIPPETILLLLKKMMLREILMITIEPVTTMLKLK